MIGMGGKFKVGIQKDQKILKKRQMPSSFGGGSGATNGMASSLAMTPMQGMDLINPDLLLRQVRDLSSGKDSYFNAKSGFSTVLNLKNTNSRPNVT